MLRLGLRGWLFLARLLFARIWFVRIRLAGTQLLLPVGGLRLWMLGGPWLPPCAVRSQPVRRRTLLSPLWFVLWIAVRRQLWWLWSRLRTLLFAALWRSLRHAVRRQLRPTMRLRSLRRRAFCGSPLCGGPVCGSPCGGPPCGMACGPSYCPSCGPSCGPGGCGAGCGSCGASCLGVPAPCGDGCSPMPTYENNPALPPGAINRPGYPPIAPPGDPIPGAPATTIPKRQLPPDDKGTRFERRPGETSNTAAATDLTQNVEPSELSVPRPSQRLFRQSVSAGFHTRVLTADIWCPRGESVAAATIRRTSRTEDQFARTE